MKKILSWILILSIVTSLYTVPVCAADISDDAVIVPNDDIETFAQQLASGLNAGRQLSLSVSEVKDLYDFAGNTYYAVEFSPVGYAIVHGQSRTIVELSVESISPYHGYDKGLFYGGPTYYYVIEQDSLAHTILDETLSEQDAEYASAANAEIHEKLCSRENHSAAAEIDAVANSTHTYIDGGDFIADLNTTNEVGYFHVVDEEDENVVYGACGFIAAGIFLLFWDQIEESLINDFAFLSSDGKSFKNPNFNQKLLFEYGTGPSSSAGGLGSESSIKEVLESYISDTYCDLDISFIRVSVPYQALLHLQNNNTPVIFFGLLDKIDTSAEGDTVAHAVTAYGWTSDNRLVVHYGWAGPGTTYSSVELNYNTAATSLYGENPRSYNIVFTDIPSTNWAYDEANYCTRYQIIDLQSKYNGNTFGYSTPMTRAMFVNGLYHLAGEPQVSGDELDDYNDISSTTQYRDALLWAKQKSCIDGISAEYMNPTGNVTREQAAVIIHGYCENEGIVITPIHHRNYRDFDDYQDISSWARESVTWAYQRGLFSGDDHENFLPQENITKAQAAVVLYQLMNMISQNVD